MGVLVDPGGLQQLVGAGLHELGRHGVELVAGDGDAVADGLLLGEHLGELLLGGLAAGGAVEVVERAELGEHRVGPGQLHLQVRRPPSRTEDRHAAPHRGRPAPDHRAQRRGCFAGIVPDHASTTS